MGVENDEETHVQAIEKMGDSRKIKKQDLSPIVYSLCREDIHPQVSSTYRATCGTIPVDLLRMTQMTGAAFQTQVSLNEQATDPVSHTPAKYRLHQ